MNKPIIILGGMGPQASLRLHELLVKKSGEFHGPNPEDFPGILHASMPVPDFIASTDKYEQAVTLVRHTCEELPLAQAGAIGLACNTAHLMVDRLPLAGTNFVSMIDAVVQCTKSFAAPPRIGLLASPHTIRTRLYAEAFARHDIEVIVPDDGNIQQLHHIIVSVIEGQDPVGLRKQLSAVGKELHAKGATHLLLGCTELPLVGLNSELPVLDSLDILAEAMLEKYYEIKV